MTIQIPESWKKLISMSFPSDLDGVKNGDVMGKNVDVDDPNPYYDDNRRITQKTPDGKVIELELASGQRNYYALYRVFENKDLLMESEPFHNFPDQIEVANKTYKLEFV